MKDWWWQIRNRLKAFTVYKHFTSSAITSHHVAILAFLLRKDISSYKKKKKNNKIELYMEIMSNFAEMKYALRDFFHWTEIMERK